jgi:hypothetical protein
VVPPPVLQFRYWLAVWSEKAAKQQDINEEKRHAVFLEGGLSSTAALLGPKPKSKPGRIGR